MAVFGRMAKKGVPKQNESCRTETVPKKHNILLKKKLKNPISNIEKPPEYGHIWHVVISGKIGLAWDQGAPNSTTDTSVEEKG